MQGRILARKEIRISCCSDTERDFEILEVFSTNNRQSGTTVARRYLRIALAQFNKMKEDSIEGERQIEQFITHYDINREEKQNKISIKLPADTRKILLFFGAIDYFAQHMHYQGLKEGTEISFYLDDVIVPTNKLHMARRMANSFITKTKKADSTSGRREAADILHEYLFHPLVPLSTHIFQRLHPDKSLAPEIAKLTSNLLEQQLTNPETTYQQKSEVMLFWLQTTLKRKSPKGQLDRAHDAGIHHELNEQVKALIVLKKNVWVLLIKSVFGKPACDGGCYDDKYYEISMLINAKLELADDGLFELDYTQTEAYKNVYARTKSGEPNLKLEVTELFKYLGLQFKSNQDFHGKLQFTALSNEKLMRRGLGWSKAACVDIIKWGRFFKGIAEAPILNKADRHLQKLIASLVPLR